MNDVGNPIKNFYAFLHVLQITAACRGFAIRANHAERKRAPRVAEGVRLLATYLSPRWRLAYKNDRIYRNDFGVSKIKNDLGG